MVARRKTTEARSSADTDLDVALAGWDPYIVAITGGEGDDLLAVGEQPGLASASASQGPESRELRLMAWLREHGTSR
jgi:hypothetical protein